MYEAMYKKNLKKYQIFLRLKSQGGETIYSFRGIPYAKPPTGNLRLANNRNHYII